MKQFKVFLFIAAAILFSSCNMSKKIVYFQDMVVMDSLAFMQEGPEIRFRPDDQLTIVVSSRDPELAALFNIMTADSKGTGGGGAGSYTIKSDGTIDFPVLGSLPVAGKTLEETSDFIKEKLLESKMIGDPVVTVNYGNLQVYVLGEVGGNGGGNTGRGIKIEHKHMTLLEAISLAGDLSINGKRENVMIMRADSMGILHAVTVDMRSIESIQKSPAYYLHQGDIVYVQPNRQRANQSTVNANSVNSIGFWTGMVSFIISLSNTFLILFK